MPILKPRNTAWEPLASVRLAGDPLASFLLSFLYFSIFYFLLSDPHVKILHRATDPRQRHRDRHDPAGRGLPVQSARVAVSGHRSADHRGQHHLSRRQRVSGSHHGRNSDRAGGQRRRGFDLYAVHQRQRRQLHADRNVRRRHRSQRRNRAGAERRQRRAVAAPAGGADPGRDACRRSVPISF